MLSSPLYRLLSQESILVTSDAVTVGNTEIMCERIEVSMAQSNRYSSAPKSSKCPVLSGKERSLLEGYSCSRAGYPVC